MKRTLAACSAILLTLPAGMCQSVRYVQTPCIAKDQAIPAEPPKVAGKLTGKADEDIKTVAASNVRLRAWGVGLRGILEGCRG
jgi:hypothetical protein